MYSGYHVLYLRNARLGTRIVIGVSISIADFGYYGANILVPPCRNMCPLGAPYKNDPSYATGCRTQINTVLLTFVLLILGYCTPNIWH